MPDPTKCGWADCDEKLVIHWMWSPLAPDDVLELLAPKCVRSSKLTKCTCVENGLACTYMCKLQAYINQKQQEAEDDSVQVGDSDDDIDGQVDV